MNEERLSSIFLNDEIYESLEDSESNQQVLNSQAETNGEISISL